MNKFSINENDQIIIEIEDQQAGSFIAMIFNATEFLAKTVGEAWEAFFNLYLASFLGQDSSVRAALDFAVWFKSLKDQELASA